MKNLNLFHKNKCLDFSTMADGKISASSIKDGVIWIQMKFKALEDFKLNLNSQSSTYMEFMCNLGDPVFMEATKTLDTTCLKSFNSGISYKKEGDGICLLFKKAGKYDISVAQMAQLKDEGAHNEFLFALKKEFELRHDAFNFISSGIPNLTIIDVVRRMNRLSTAAACDKMIIHGHIQTLFGLKLKCYIEKKDTPKFQSVLTPKEIICVQTISDTVQKYPEQRYVIEHVCREAGLGISKLQTGFKELHGQTFCSFVTDQKLNKSITLLEDLDLNISDIVYSLGWTSRSYFSKIFSTKFECSPSRYRTGR